MDAVLPSSLPLIQLAITPVILISGVGGLMLSLMNRMGRVVDRSRALAGQMRTATGVERSHLESQLEVMWRRAKLVRTAVTCAAFSMLLSCTLVMLLFVGAWMHFDLSGLLTLIFVASVGLLIAALVAFLRDISLSLAALEIEVERARKSE
jgi:hypothetical protein